MNLVWHIAKKDLRSHWLLYAVWVGLLVSKVVICVLIQSPNSASQAWFEQMSLGYWLAVVIESALGFLLAAAFILEDGLVGSDMFWPTRPISGARLLAAKATGIGLLLCVVPVLVWLPWWSLGGFGLRDYAQSAFYVLAVQLLTVLPAVLFAILAGRSSRFLLALLLTVAVLFVLSFTKSVAVGQNPAPSLAVSTVRFWINLAILGLTTVSVIWIQFTTRQTKKAASLLAAGIVAMAAVTNYWPWTLGLKPLEWGRKAADVDGVGLEITRVGYGSGTVAKGLMSLEFQLTLTNLPGDMRARSGRAAITHTWQDGFTYTHEVQFSSAVTMPEQPPRHTLGVTASIWKDDEETRSYVLRSLDTIHRDQVWTSRLHRLYSRDTSEVGYQLLKGSAAIPVEIAQRIREQNPVSSIQVSLTMDSPRIRLNVPVPIESQVLIGEGMRAAIFPARYVNPSPEDSRWAGFYIMVSRPMLGERISFCVLHKKTGYFSPVSFPMGSRYLIPDNTSFQRNTVWVPKPFVRRGDRWISAQGADEGYELIAFTREVAGTLHRNWTAEVLPWRIPNWKSVTPAK